MKYKIGIKQGQRIPKGAQFLHSKSGEWRDYYRNSPPDNIGKDINSCINPEHLRYPVKEK